MKHTLTVLTVLLLAPLVALDAHFGLAKATSADLKLTLLNGKTLNFPGVKADRFLDLNLNTTTTTVVETQK